MSLFKPMEEDFRKLKGQVVVLTGGASGIGASTVKLVHSEGASVVFGDVNRDAGEALATSLGSGATFVPVDVTVYGDHVKLFKTALSTHGHVDHAFCIAGTLGREDWFNDELTVEDVMNEEMKSHIVDVNLWGTLYFCRVALPFLRHGGANRAGKDKSLALISSSAGFEDSPGVCIYSSTKHGVLGIMRALRKEHMPVQQRDVRVNALCPSFVRTNMTEPLGESWVAAGMSTQTPEDIGKVLMGLATQDVNGMAVYCSGGKAWDIESGLGRLKAQWAGQEAADEGVKIANWRKKLGGDLSSAMKKQ